MTIIFFARARDLAQMDRLSLDLPAATTIAQLRRHIAERIPALASLIERCAFAVNEDYADEHQEVPPQAEVAVLPPVSGG